MSVHSAAPQNEPLPSSLEKAFTKTPEPQVSVENLSGDKTETAAMGAEASLDTKPVKKKFKFLPKLWHKIVFGIFVFLLILGGIAAAVGFYVYGVAMELKAQAQDTLAQSRIAYDVFKTQNLPQTEAELVKVQEKVAGIEQTYSKLAFLNSIPFANAYYQDGQHGINAGKAGVNAAVKSIKSIAPHADLLGFTGEGTFTGGTAEDRLKLLIKTLDEVSPMLSDIAGDMDIVKSEMNAIDANRYPEKIGDIEVRSRLLQTQSLAAAGSTALNEYRPVIAQLPAMAGGRDKRMKYLVIFQNNGELRATGGFMTGYATIFVENGKVMPEKSDDIYELDKKFTKRLPIPEALGRYLTTEKYFNLRDMNTSPDLKTSMDQFMANYATLKSEPQDIDGIILVDTHVLTDLIRVLGPVNVPGYGTFTADTDPRCDCPNIIYELSNVITRPTPYIRTDRKGILGPLMREILNKFYLAPRDQWPLVFEAALGKADDLGKGGWIGSRAVQMYFFDPELQKVAETINAAGRLPEPKKDADFLAIVDANLGGAKSNFFITSDIKQTVSAPENGVITKTVEVTYKNSRKGDNCNLEAGLLCLNSTLRDWHRLYLPAGSKLVEAQGFTQAPKEYEEAGYSVIDGFFILEPNSQAKIKVTYTVPYTDATTYRLDMWKQGGVETAPVLIDVNGSEEQLTLDRDRSLEVAF
jgi:hypothetical protein